MIRGWWIDALRSLVGRELLSELSAEEISPRTELRLITKLRARYDAELVSAALAQVKLRERAREKFSRAADMLFTAPGLEQASSERMAAHHATRFAPYLEIADLCSGIGGDLIGLAAERSVVAVDSDGVHSRLGVVNAEAYGVSARVNAIVADVRDVSLHSIRAVFVDPARRADDKRLRAGASEPPLEWCFDLAERGIAVGTKAAPGLPTELVPEGWELEFVSERRELKESALWSPALATAVRRATILPTGDTLVASVDAHGPSLDVREPGDFLVDPDPAVTRAGLVETLGVTLGEFWKIDEQVAFLSSNAATDTPFGRTLRIEASMPWNLKRVNEALRG
ncbi:MAG TPA: hypothetical protein VGM50_12375, partial [Gemmatimonadaceae bacterium]